MKRTRLMTPDEQICVNCQNDGIAAPIGGVVHTECEGGVNVTLYCELCGYSWDIDECEDGFSTHSNDEREC